MEKVGIIVGVAKSAHSSKKKSGPQNVYHFNHECGISSNLVVPSINKIILLPSKVCFNSYVGQSIFFALVCVGRCVHTQTVSAIQRPKFHCHGMAWYCRRLLGITVFQLVLPLEQLSIGKSLKKGCMKMGMTNKTSLSIGK